MLRSKVTKNTTMATRTRNKSAKIKENAAIATMLEQTNDQSTKDQNETLKTMVMAMMQSIENLTRKLEDQAKMAEEIATKRIEEEVAKRMEELKSDIAKTIQTQLANAYIPAPATGSPTYAEIAKTPPVSRPSNVSPVSSGITPTSTMTDTLYCTVDMSRVIEQDRGAATPQHVRKAVEEEMRKACENNWRCTAVVRDIKNPARIRITCKDEEELRKVKNAAAKTAVEGARVMRDQLYPVKVDNACKEAVLNDQGEIRDDAKERLGDENGVKIAKIVWLSKKDTTKAYGSLVVYLTKGSDAMKLLHGQYFDLNGESAFTTIFEQRIKPIQCYNCQEIGHKAYACKKQQLCGKCAGKAHHHKECIAEVPKCANCNGPHEAYSRNCKKLYPQQT